MYIKLEKSQEEFVGNEEKASKAGGVEKKGLTNDVVKFFFQMWVSEIIVGANN